MDMYNRILLHRDTHRSLMNPYWLQMQRYMEKYGRW
jgi:hypothetical protein